MTVVARRMRDRHRNPNFRKIIGGIAYDTETASVIAEQWYDEDIDYQISGPQHPYDVGEVLYQNKWDQYFLYCFCEANDIMPEEIRPLTREEAIAWMEKHCPTEMIEDVFGKMKEAGET